MGHSGRHVSREGWRLRERYTVAARAACFSFELDRRTERALRRARSCYEPHGPPHKSESLQKDQRAVRYNRFDSGVSLVERISPLSAGEAWRSALGGEDRRVSNSGLRGHCRAD